MNVLFAKFVKLDLLGDLMALPPLYNNFCKSGAMSNSLRKLEKVVTDGIKRMIFIKIM